MRVTCTICCFPKPVCLQISCHEFLSMHLLLTLGHKLLYVNHAANDETKGKWSYLMVVRELTIVTLVTQLFCLSSVK